MVTDRKLDNFYKIYYLQILLNPKTVSPNKKITTYYTNSHLPMDSTG